jgi:hypothetical protein
MLPLPQAMNWSSAINLWLLGTFMALWALRRGLHPLAAVVSGALLMFCGPYFAHAHAGHVTNLATMTWVPLLFLALDGWLGTRKLEYCLLGMVAFAMQLLAGHPQYVFYSLISLSLYAGLRLLGARSDARWAALGLFAIFAGRRSCDRA